jgi:hypothetical protein
MEWKNQGRQRKKKDYKGTPMHGINPNTLKSHSFPKSGKGRDPENASASRDGNSTRPPEGTPEQGAAPGMRRADSMPAGMAAAHAANDREPLAPLAKRRYTAAEKGKGKAEEPAASSAPGGDASEASLKHFVRTPPSDEWNETMTLRDYIGHLNTKASSSGSSGSGSDVLAAAGYDVNGIIAKNGRLADMESRYFAPKMDPKFERTVENSPGYQKDFNPDNYEGPQRPRDHWLEKERPFASLPPELRKKWDDDPKYMPKHELERRYDHLKSENAGLRADNARLQGQVEGLQAEAADAKSDLKKAERDQLKMGALGALGGLAAGTVAGMVLDSGGSANPPAPPQNPAVI